MRERVLVERVRQRLVYEGPDATPAAVARVDGGGVRPWGLTPPLSLCDGPCAAEPVVRELRGCADRVRPQIPGRRVGVDLVGDGSPVIPGGEAGDDGDLVRSYAGGMSSFVRNVTDGTLMAPPTVSASPVAVKR